MSACRPSLLNDIWIGDWNDHAFSYEEPTSVDYDNILYQGIYFALIFMPTNTVGALQAGPLGANAIGYHVTLILQELHLGTGRTLVSCSVHG